MHHSSHRVRFHQRGIVLVASLLLLIVVTIMALSIFRSFGGQEKIAGNTREKQRALQAAVSAEQFAEWWIAAQSNAPVAVSQDAAAAIAIKCTVLLDANQGQAQICNNTLASNNILVTQVPWTVGGAPGTPIGMAYNPPTMSVPGSPCAANCVSTDTYYARPRFYVADMGQFGRFGELYQVDAYGYGLTSNSISEVESTVVITCIVC
jgi:type IV pilus assembly protein PilX